ncbi:lipid A export permease/ATP-binding protein MsbA [Ectothiorhodospiraceae bacterium 2226]|nr:lipid A export permease/ATP-binding protein MsbA [Ectothiorhodospiraceae bacterium 2226]
MNEQPRRETGTRIYRRLLGYVFPTYWKAFAVAVAAMGITAATEPAFAWLMRPMLDGSFVEQDPNAIRYVPIALIGVFVLRGIGEFLSTFWMKWVARRVIKDLRSQMFSHLLRLPTGYYDRVSSGQLLSKVIYDVEQVAGAASNAITVLIKDTLTVIGLFALMFYLSTRLTLTFLIIAPFMALIVVYVSRRFRRLSKRIQASMGGVSHASEEVIEGQRVIKIFGGQRHESDQFERINEQNRRQHMKHTVTNAISVPLTQFIVAGAVALIVFVATRPGMLEVITVGTFVSFMTAMLLLMQPVRRLTTINATLQQGIAAAQSVFEFLDHHQEVDTGTKRLARARGEVEYRGVEFAYDPDKGKVLHGIDLHIRPGQTVAFVGRSGSGKSTLVNLLPRFYDLQQGRILLDGHDVRELTLASLRQQIALVSQHVTLFNDTIAHNIAYGSLERATPADIERAAEAAHALEFIRRLPEGLDTPVGENGVLLSGGQRQRLAIARALLKDAPVLILDEATSALDTESERYIQAGLEALMQNRTTLVIAHRLSTIERADQIVVMDGGRIIEVGRHDELLAADGYYARLHAMQFNEAT